MSASLGGSLSASSSSDSNVFQTSLPQQGLLQGLTTLPAIATSYQIGIAATVSRNDHRVQELADHSTICRLFETDRHLYDLVVAVETSGLRSAEVVALADYLSDIRPELVTPISVSEVQDSKNATLKSWDHDYQGSAHRALWHHIKHNLQQDKMYSPMCSIVQSSGTGKSRCIDELSKERLVVTLNLRDPDAGGFPASDRGLHTFFKDVLTAPNKQILVEAFLCAVFEGLESLIRTKYDSPEHGSLAAWYRSYMAEKQTFDSQGPNRVAFFDTVVKRSKELALTAKVDKVPAPALGSSGAAQPLSPPKVRFDKGPRSTQEMAQQLRDTIKMKTQSEPDEPHTVFAYDEAHTLTGSTSPYGFDALSPVVEHLRRSLRTVGRGVFSIFLSTTGKITQFTVPPEMDPSNRVSSGALHLISPITAMGWDLLAHAVPRKPTFQDIGFRYQIFLGRPLFGTRYVRLEDPEPMIAIRDFAATKLLRAPYPSGFTGTSVLSPAQEAAILSHRVPIEFMSTVHAAQERNQVENHMRICLSVCEDFISLKTINSSEPLLSEAASNIMSNPHVHFDAPGALSKLFTGFSINAGDRGEMVAMLLLTLARDKVVHAANKRLGDPGFGFFSVEEFLKSLFSGISFDKGKGTVKVKVAGKVAGKDKTLSIFAAKPSVYNHKSAKDKTLLEAFEGVSLHFNHVVKRGAQGFKFGDKSTPQSDPTRLLGFFIRNAALMGANSQFAMDISLLMCKGIHVQVSSMSIILIQAKNTPAYSSKIHQSLFDAMNPVTLGIFKPNDRPTVPIIRIVMALGGRKPVLKCVGTQRQGTFTSYDIWASGLSADVYPLVSGKEDKWRDILQASQSGWKDVYNGQEGAKEMKMSMTPMVGDEDAHWSWLKSASAAPAAPATLG
ncbi:hypothetical protein PENSPDRAFT_602890 [Peniophora sp. CONT]|nr:hypothetical protein PENSPDRAFT_602890 [Peniophora sp. CONT]